MPLISAPGAEAGISRSLRPACSTCPIQVPPGLPRETLSQEIISIGGNYDIFPDVYHTHRYDDPLYSLLPIPRSFPSTFLRQHVQIPLTVEKLLLGGTMLMTERELSIFPYRHGDM